MDLILRNGTAVKATDTLSADVGIEQGWSNKSAAA